MRKLLTSLALLVSSHAFADGIPVPMDQQTPYNWKCEGDVSLHLFLEGERATLFVSSNSGGSVGSKIPLDIAALMIGKSYSSPKINGKSFVDSQFNRLLKFNAQTTSTVNVTLSERDNNYSEQAKNCRARF